MTSIPCTTFQRTLVGVDIAKKYNDVLVDEPGRRRRGFRVANQSEDYQRFARVFSTDSPSARSSASRRPASTTEPWGSSWLDVGSNSG
jgi:hypothetical protein